MFSIWPTEIIISNTVIAQIKKVECITLSNFFYVKFAESYD